MTTTFMLNANAWLEFEPIRQLSYEMRGIFIELICYEIRFGGLPQTTVQMMLNLNLPMSRLMEFKNVWDNVFSAFFRLNTSGDTPKWVWKHENRFIRHFNGDEVFNPTPEEVAFAGSNRLYLIGCDLAREPELKFANETQTKRKQITNETQTKRKTISEY